MYVAWLETLKTRRGIIPNRKIGACESRDQVFSVHKQNRQTKTDRLEALSRHDLNTHAAKRKRSGG